MLFNIRRSVEVQVSTRIGSFGHSRPVSARPTVLLAAGAAPRLVIE